MNTPDEWVKQAENLLSEGRLDEAVQAYHEALTLDTEHLEALLGAGALSLSLDLPEEGRLLIERVRELFPDNPRGQVLHGLWQEGTGDEEAALSTYAEAATQHPDSYATRYHYGRALIATKRIQEAVTELQKSIELGPENIEAHYALGTAYQLAGDITSSIKQFSYLIELEPSYLDGYVTLVDVLAEAQQFEMALEVLERASKIAPEVDLLDEKRAAILVQLGQLVPALEVLQTLAARQEEPKDILFSIAAFALTGGELEIAVGAANQLLERYPGEWRTQQLYAQLLDAADKPEEAVKALQKAHRLAPQAWQPLNDLGDLLNGKAQTHSDAATQAVDVLTEACRLAPPEELAPRYNLILSYWNANHHKRAHEAAKLLIASHDTAHPIVQQTQAVLEAIEETMMSGQA